jgi:catechol 2,3-dioxygenase-like lactoylglutathione lyase family enzyme
MAKINVGRVVWLGVVVKDLAAMRRFYTDVAGLDLIESGRTWAHLDLGAGHLLELLQLSDEPPDDKKGFRPGFQVKDIEAARQELIAQGAKPVGEIEGGAEMGGRWCSFQDAEGNYFEIKQVMRAAAKKRSTKQSTKKSRSAKTTRARKRGK